MPTRGRSKTVNPYMASSTLKKEKCERLIDAFALALPPTWAAEFVNVKKETAANFYELLLLRMSDMSFFDPVIEYMLLMDTNVAQEFNDWSAALLRRHRGFKDDLARTAYFSKYSWLWYMGNLHVHAFESYDDELQAVEYIAKVISAELRAAIKITGPLNRDPYEEDCNAAYQKHLANIDRKKANLKAGFPVDELKSFVKVKQTTKLRSLLQ